MILQHTQWTLFFLSQIISKRNLCWQALELEPLLADKSLQFFTTAATVHFGNEDLTNGLTEPPIGPHHKRSPNSVKPRWMWQTHTPQVHWQKFFSLSGRACYQAELFLYQRWAVLKRARYSPNKCFWLPLHWATCFRSHYNTRCPYTSSDFIRFWVNSLVVLLNRDQ